MSVLYKDSQSELDRLNRHLPKDIFSLICTYLPMPYPEGAHYDGEYYKGKFHGKGKYVRKDGLTYEGEWEDGKEHGHGIESLGDYRYEGEWEQGDQHGKGVITYGNGDVYIGNMFYGDTYKPVSYTHLTLPTTPYV